MKMIYKTFSIAALAAMLMTLGLAHTVIAAPNSSARIAGEQLPRLIDLARVPSGERLPRFIDDEDLLTQAQAAELTAKLDEISERHQFDTVVAVVYSLQSGSLRGREAWLYAVDFFEQNGFGFGSDLDGAILLIATEDRDFGFASTGFGLKAFTDAGQEYLEKLFLPHLKEDNYFEAFMTYADAVDDFVTNAKAGKPYAEGNIPLTPSERTKYRIWREVRE